MGTPLPLHYTPDLGYQSKVTPTFTLDAGKVKFSYSKNYVEKLLGAKKRTGRIKESNY